MWFLTPHKTQSRNKINSKPAIASALSTACFAMMRVLFSLAFRGAFAFLVLSTGTVEPVAALPNDDLGKWGDVFDLTVIPIHAMLLPDSQILMYGSDDQGEQGGDIFYEVWDPRSGDHQNQENHKLSQHSTGVNIFCTTSTIDISTGNFVLIGGDNGNNKGVTDVLEFDTKTLEMREHPKGHMKYPRWYATSVGLPNGNILVVGGKGRESDWESATCELWTPDEGFHELPGTEIPAIKEGKNGSWWYPIVVVNSSGDIIVIIAEGDDTDVYRLDVNGDGSIEKVGNKPFSMDKLGPSLMFDVDHVMMIATDGGLWVADISDSTNIVFTEKNNVGTGRTNGALNVFPDGRVIITGGSDDDKNDNEVEGAVKHVQIWDPIANTIYEGPEEELPRLYHSSAIILPDGSIYSGGGGAPGPLKNLNGNIYFPGYLFDPDSGEDSTRPVILSWPRNLQAGEAFDITVDDANSVEQVTMTKPGSMTHSRNYDHRWLDLGFKVINERTLRVYTPNRNVMIPGLWMVNVISTDGFPSEGRLMGVDMAAATNIYVPEEDVDLSPTAPMGLPSSSPSEQPSESPSEKPFLSPSAEPSQSPLSPPSPRGQPDEAKPIATPPPTKQPSESQPILTQPSATQSNQVQLVVVQPPTRPPTGPNSSVSLGGLTWQVSVSP